MTLTQAPPDPGAAAAALRHDVHAGLVDIATWVVTNPDAEIPGEWTVQLDVPKAPHEVKVRWLRNVAAGWGTVVAEDADGTLRTEKRSGPVRVVAAVAPADATVTGYLSRTARVTGAAEAGKAAAA